MIAATSEALIDLVINQHGRLGAQAGGGPLNMAKIIGRLGLAPAFLSRLSQDGPGRVLGARLDQDGVMLRAPQLTDAPAILAVADVDPAGAPVNSDDSAPPPRARQATELRQIRRRAPWAVMAVTGSTQAGALIGKVMDDAARPADRG